MAKTSAPPSSVEVDIPDEEEVRIQTGFVNKMLGTSSFWIGLVVLALIALFSIISPDHAFFQLSNFEDMLLDVTETAILALGMTFLLGAGELDLSVGANLLLSSVFAGEVILTVAGTPTQTAAGQYPNLGLAIILGVAVGVGTGMTYGAVNGLLVSRLGISSFIVTLGTMGIGTGISFIATGGFNIPYLPPQMQTRFGINKLFGVIPLETVVLIVAAVIFWYLLAATRFGLRTLAMGSSRQAAIRSGFDVKRHTFVLFVIMGFMAGIDGVLDLFRYGTTNVGGHTTDALTTIAAVVIGGTSLFGGVASITGSMIGSSLPVVLNTGLIIQGVESFYQLIVVGIILIIAVYLDHRRRMNRQ